MKLRIIFFSTFVHIYRWVFGSLLSSNYKKKSPFYKIWVFYRGLHIIVNILHTEGNFEFDVIQVNKIASFASILDGIAWNIWPIPPKKHPATHPTKHYH